MRTIGIADHSSTDGARAFGDLLLELGRRRPFRDPIAGSSEELEFTPAQFHTFLWLGHDGPLAMGELARRLCVTEKSVTGLIDRLAKGGHVRRQRDESDRRVIHVGLTKKGQQIFKRLNEHFTRKLGQFLEALDASDRKDLFRILQKVLDRAHRPLAANESHSRG